MSSIVFNFAVTRSVQPDLSATYEGDSFYLADSNEGLLDSLRKARKQNDKAGMLKLSHAFVRSSTYVINEEKLGEELFKFMDILINKANSGYNQQVRDSFKSIFNTTPTNYIEGTNYAKIATAVSESIVAASIDASVSSKQKSLLTNLARSLHVIQLLSEDKTIIKKKVLSTSFVLPPEIFPLPLSTTNLQEHRKKAAEAQKKGMEERQKQILQLTTDLKSYRSSIDELTTLFDNSSSDNEDNTPVIKKGGFLLPKNAAQKLSLETKTVIKKIGFSADEVDIAKTINGLEKKASQAAMKIYANAGSGGRSVRIGQNEVTVPAFDFPILEIGISKPSIPGACPPVEITASTDSTPITTNGKHDVRNLGVMDLLVVEQELARYELGEIAHIENVLKSEVRDRKYKVTDLSEETVTTETEETDTKENDLSSTERFELQSEAQKIINENTSMSAAATVSASYGVVDSTANFNYSNSNALSESQRTASNFARETISKAVSKLEKRNLQRRITRTMREVEETNRHTFDNKTGTGNITGVYRFVDKIYNTQIINYGKRLILEFVVPEPAAFLRHFMTLKPTDSNNKKPDEPGYCSGNGKVFTPLRVSDINADNYLLWAARYGVENIIPPPAELMIIGKAISKDGQDLKKETSNEREKYIYWHSESLPIDIINGYLPVKAHVQADFTYVDVADESSESTNQKITIQIGDKQVTFRPSPYPSGTAERKAYDPNGGNNFAEINIVNHTTNGLPVTISSWGVMAFGLTITVLCRRTPEALAKWQIQTYNAIIATYKDQLTRYNNTAETARIQAGFTEISGTNPLANRETERTELKRGCITLLTGQHFEGFDAVNRNVDANGYPEIDFDEAAEEGKFISFFEQAFEWNNMTYVFYPYFWAKKDQWNMLSQLTDTDPQFASFLQAGSCRVNVPVRISFEKPILNYVNNNILWDAEGSFINAGNGRELDMLHLALLGELKSQLNNMNTAGAGKLIVTKDNKTVTGLDTTFTEADENKRIIIAGKTYVIKQVDTAGTIHLKTPYSGESEENLSYSFGGQLYGDSWEVKLPTELVKIDETGIF